jgi:hypothetical protein
MLDAVLIFLLAVGLAALVYLGLERLGRRAWVPLLCRAAAWTALGLLLINLSCPARGTPLRPLVLLDASLSLGAPGARWAEARDSALRWGEVRTFGDERLTSDTVPTRGRSLLASALLAASASERPIVIVSDGEIEDRSDIPPDILARSGVRLFPRAPRPDLAITRVTGPHRVTAGDTISLEVVIQASGSTRETVGMEVVSGTTRLATRSARVGGEGGGRMRVGVPSSALTAGDHLLRVTLLRTGDAEPRTDTRLHLVTVAPTPGVVFLAGPTDWDSRFLYQTLREVAQLPVRGYARLAAGQWRSMADLRRVSPDQIRRAARGADLLILKGRVAEFAQGTSARGVWHWPSGERGEVAVPGDWYLTAPSESPVAGAFLAQPLDSFPPAIQLTTAEPGRYDWVALNAQLGRRGPQRPAVLGRRAGRVREVAVVADGLWRWAFRGAASEQTYRSWVASTTSWLLAAPDSARGLARPIHPVVTNGRPVQFQWAGTGSPTAEPVVWSGSGGDRGDTLHFDGDGRATAWLEPGEYRYRLGSGGAGTVAVERYSDELLSRPVSLTAHEGRAVRPSARTAARDWLWLFGLCILALSGEWLARRRLGLR